MTSSFSDELYHHGIKGMKWGVRRTPEQLGHRSTSIRAAIARRKNEKVDASFKKWEEESKKRDNAITLGKEANAKRMIYENEKTRENKRAYSVANREYKKALRSNTTYRKGTVRAEVGKDASRKSLSEAKRIKKLLAEDPTNRSLQKKYDRLMSDHDVYRESARRAQAVGAARSKRKAAVKRAMTMTVKAAATSAAVGVGIKVANKYLLKDKFTMNSKQFVDLVKKGKKVLQYIY